MASCKPSIPVLAKPRLGNPTAWLPSEQISPGDHTAPPRRSLQRSSLAPEHCLDLRGRRMGLHDIAIRCGREKICSEARGCGGGGALLS